MDLIIESCCLFTSNPAEQMSATGDYTRIFTHDNAGNMVEIFRGKQWLDEDFEQKARDQGHEPREWMKHLKVQPVIKPLA